MAFDLVAAYAQSDTPFYLAGETAATLLQAPQQITLRFTPGARIDPASLAGSISIVRSGGAGDAFGNGNDIQVLPGAILVEDAPNQNQVVVRFAETLPDDTYRITVGSGLTSLAAGDTVRPASFDVRLDAAAFVRAVVPQPVVVQGSGTSYSLAQSRDQIQVFFNTEDPLDQSSAVSPGFYRLQRIDPATAAAIGPAVNPTQVAYSSSLAQATLVFGNGELLAEGLFRLEIGGSEPLTPVVFNDNGVPHSSFTTARNLGSLGPAGATINGEIAVRPTFTSPAGTVGFPTQPGTLDEPGHRNVPVDSGQHGTPAFATVEPATGLTTIPYNFRPVIGQDPQGNDLPNVITEAQKQRAREIFELFSLYAGVRFVETADQGLMVATGDLRAFSPSLPPDGGVAGLGGGAGALMNSSINWGDSEYGGSWFNVAMHEIGHALGLQHTYDLPAIMGSDLPGERVFPGDYDIHHLRQLFPTSGSDIDVYRFTLAEAGRLSAETVVARPGQPVTSLLDSVLSLYREETVAGRVVRTLVARNDDFYGRDSFIGLDLAPGTYFIAVTSTGNTAIDPTVSDSGSGGRSEGDYRLDLKFTSAATAANTVLDRTGRPLDGDRDGKAGGVFRFWFNTASEADTIFVHKGNPNAGGGSGTPLNPFKTISAALAAVQPSTRIIRIIGDTGMPYQVGVDAFNRPLSDGSSFNVPRGVTVMIDRGAVFKLRSAIIDVGSSSQLVSRAGAALQVLGVPGADVVFTSWHDDSIGGNTDGAGPAAQGGQWGGIVFRQDSDAASRRAFVNAVTHADVRFGGGQVRVDSQIESFAPIQLESTRPTVVFNTITSSAGAAIAATPNSFEDTGERVGPEFRGNRLLGNSINGLFVKIETLFGTPLDRLDVPARWKSTDIVYVIQENLVINGGVGGYELVGTDIVARPTGRLAIDPGVVVKLQNSRIELERGLGQLIAEGTAFQEVVFTSIGDNRYGAGGTFDTNGNLPDKFDGSGQPVGTLSVGDWGGIVLNAGSRASIDHAYLAFGGGVTPIEGRFDAFNVIETHQGDLRLANSRVEYNAAGTAATDRSGRGGNAAATVFVRGAQPILVGNDFRSNLGAVVHVNANSLAAVSRPDVGRSTGAIDRFAGYDDNLGPLVRGNVLAYAPGRSAIAGMVVRGAQLTVESVWDDTDIVHVLQDEIIVQNLHSATGIRLQSRPEASLVVKLDGADAGFTAAGYGLDINERIGGTVQVVGYPLYPVVLTSLRDDSVGASLDPLGRPVRDTNADGSASTPTAGDWRSLRFLPFSNDRNVAVVLEGEGAYTGGTDGNGLTDQAQWLGVLAPNFAAGTNSWESAQEKSGDENRRLGFEVHGSIAFDDPSDVDVYSFLGYAGSEVWIDIDKTSPALDAMVELLDSAGNVLARSVDAGAEGGVVHDDLQIDFLGGLAVTYQLGRTTIVPGTLTGVIYDLFTGEPSQTFFLDAAGVIGFHTVLGAPLVPATGGSLDPATGQLTLTFAGAVGPTAIEARYSYRTDALAPIAGIGQVLAKDAWRGDDHYTLNPRDPGMRVVLPGSTGVQTQYLLRVRSQPRYEPAATGADNGNVAATSLADYRAGLTDPAGLEAGATSGSYELRVRLRQRDEKPGSTVIHADIRYPTIGIEAEGLPRNSHLVAETGETSTDANNTFATAQYIGNVLQSDRAGLSVAGTVAGEGDIDWYTFALNYEQLQSIPGVNEGPYFWSGVFDIDYADGFRGDLTISVFDEAGTLIYTGRDSDVADDQPGPGQNTDFDDLSRGSVGKLDAYLGTVSMEAGGPTGTGGIESGLPPTPPNPAAQRRYYVAISSNERLPTQLNATFNAVAANTLVRLEPITSVKRVVEDRIGSGDTPIIDTLNLAAHVTPFTLADVTLFVTTGTSLVTVDAMRGGIETTLVGNYGAGSTIGDMVMRSDGELYMYRGVAGSTTTAGQLARVDSGTGAVTVVGNDGIRNPITATQLNLAPTQTGTVGVTTFNLTGDNLRPPQDAPITGTVRLQVVDTSVDPAVTRTGNWNFTANPAAINAVATLTITPGAISAGLGNAPVAGTVNLETGVVSFTWQNNVAAADVRILTVSYQYTFSDIATNEVDAIAWRRAGVGDYQDLVYSIWDPANAQSVLYLADPATGSAALVNNTNWGIQGTLDAVGRTTGMAWLGGVLYGVDTDGGLFTITGINDGNFTVTTIPITTVLDGNGLPIAFQGLTVGPQNLEGGFYANLLFGIDDGGNLYCFDTLGNLQTVFDSDGDGVVDADSIASGQGGARGLAFSPLDINLWHSTTRREGDLGHGIDVAPDGTRTERVAGGTSLYFGLESGGPQYGGGATWQQDLLANPLIGNNYNLPGGAYGSLTTDSFSLAGYAYTDKPTLYFNYFLQTQGAASRTNGMRDSARVLGSIDGGLTWELLATNNSTRSDADTSNSELPAFTSVSSKLSDDTIIQNQHVQELFDTANWRQARVDLGKFAGQASVRLRFDFSTAGEFDPTQRDANGNLLNDIVRDTTGRYLTSALPGLANTTGDFGSAQRGQNNQFEGFYVDDIMVGFAERGEMVTSSTAAATTFFDVGTPDPSATVAAQALLGPYQLEIRRGTEYFDGVEIFQTFDTNDRLVPERGNASAFGSWIGDRNLPSQQGQLVIQGNVIAHAAQYGIRIDAGPREGGSNAPFPGSPRSLPTLNNARLTAGAFVANNVIAHSGTAGILFSGDATAGSVPRSSIPFGRIVNNTIYGGATPRGVGVQVTDNAGPTLLNNLFANLATGVSVDASSRTNTVIGTSAYASTLAGVAGAGETNPIILETNPFVNAAAGNFYLAPGSRAIDSSLNSLQDRPEFVVVNTPLGITASPILAPDYDVYGQLRGDDPTVANLPGLGSNVFKDRGAIDRVDFAQPAAFLVHPLDGGPDDLDPGFDAVTLRAGGVRSLARFEIQLRDSGAGIDRATVRSEAFTITRDGQLLVEGIDYTFVYRENTNLVVFEAAALFQLGSYVITARTQPTVAGAAGLLTDRANNTLLPNKFDGSTTFTINLADAPNAPTSLTGLPGDSQVALAWTAPAGGPAPTGYRVRWRAAADPNGWSAWVDTGSTATASTVAPLVNGTPYVFQVVAFNAIGDSPAVEGGPFTPFAPAPAPLGLGATPSVGPFLTGVVTLTWTAPSVPLGSGSISDYIVEYRAVGASEWIRNLPDPISTATSDAVYGLVNGRAYEFRVTTITTAGPGLSAVATATTLGLPAAPTGVAVTSADTSATVNWIPVANGETSGGSPVTGYRVEWSTTGLSWSGIDVGVVSGATIGGLANNVTYLVRVAARNAQGLGPFAAAGTTVTPRPQAAAPTRLIGRAGNGTVSLVWTAPRNTGGQPIVNYLIQYTTNYAGDVNAATWVSVTSGSALARASIAVPNGVRYVFRVAAVTPGGTGRFSLPSPALVPFAPGALPAAPTAISVVSPVARRVEVAWTPPPPSEGGPIVAYVLQYRTATGGAWSSIRTTAPSRIITGLASGRDYVFRVRAQNLAGLGSFSPEVTVRVL